MDVRSLRAFVRVTELGSISAAAGELGWSQPGLSHRISLLERDVGSRLFVRRSDGVRLTKSGRVLLTYARVLLGVVDMLEEELRSSCC